MFCLLQQWTGCINQQLLIQKLFIFFRSQGLISGCVANSRREGHSNEDSAQGVVFSFHSDGRTNLQITEWVQTAHISSLGHPRHITKVGALRTWGRLKWSEVQTSKCSNNKQNIFSSGGIWVCLSPVAHYMESPGVFHLEGNPGQRETVDEVSRCNQTPAHPEK